MSATLAGVPFALDPHSVRWEYDVHTADAPFMGGKVVQVFGATIGDITVEGYFRGSQDHRDQMAFLERMKSIADAKVNNPKQAPFRFVWPEQKWDFQVYLRHYQTPDGGGRSIRFDPAVFAPRWRLVLFPVHGTARLRQATITSFIDRLSKGMGWKPSLYNGPMTFNDLQSAMASMGASDVADLYGKAYGVAQTASGNPLGPGGAAPGGTIPTGRVLSAEEVVTVANRAGLSGSELRTMAAIAKAESSWNPGVVNDNPGTGDYSVGLWQINMLAHKERFGTEAELKIPERNAAAMVSLLRSQGLNAWSVYRSGAYRAHLPEVEAAAARLGL